MCDPICIIAWGNRGRRDDGVALALAEQLEKRLAGDPDISVRQFHQLGPEVAADLEQCRLAVFLDADVRENGDAVQVSPLLPSASSGFDTHHCSPGTLLALGRSLGCSMPDAYLISIRAYDLAFGDQLSPMTEQGMHRAEEVIIEMIDRQRRRTNQEVYSHA